MEDAIREAYEELKYLRRLLRQNPTNVVLKQEIEIILKWLEENERSLKTD